MSITAKELAAHLGLSEAAISMALNNKPGVSNATRKRIFDAAHELGYDFSKKSWSGPMKKGTLCFVIYRKSGAVVGDTPFFSALSDGISIGCKKASYDLVLRYLYEDEGIPGQLSQITAADFAGVILLATEMDAATLSSFRSLHLPIVVLDAYFENVPYDYVLINNTQGAYLAANYLIAKRKKQPGYLHSSYSIANFEERADGFYKAIRANGMSTSRSRVHRLTPSQEGAYADMKELLASGAEPCNCFFSFIDHIAIGAMAAIREAGYRIPEDVAIIGFDDLPVSSFTDPPLTTVQASAEVIGETAAGRLIQIIEAHDTHPKKIEIGTTLKKRKSV